MYAASRSKMHLSSSFRFSQGKEAQSEWRIASTLSVHVNFWLYMSKQQTTQSPDFTGKMRWCTVRSSFNKRKHSRTPASTNGSAMNDTVQSNHVVTENKLKEKRGMVYRNEANRKNSGSQLWSLVKRPMSHWPMLKLRNRFQNKVFPVKRCSSVQQIFRFDKLQLSYHSYHLYHVSFNYVHS